MSSQAEAQVRGHLQALREGVLHDLCIAGERIMLTPGVRQSTKTVKALRATLKAYDELVVASSTSTPGFADRDLPIDEKARAEKARHLVGVIDELYGEKIEAG